jgi:threonine aldolase
MFQGIDLYSDTGTRPSAPMKQAMVDAPLGDEQRGEDPTTAKLEERMAAMLGKQTAIFLPSSTMANQIAILLHCQRGDELIAAENSHIFFAEGGAPAIWAGALARPIETQSGIFTGQAVRAKFNVAKSPNYPVSRLVVCENTTNMGGGVAWKLSELKDVWDTCSELDLRTHLDGSRFFNAVASSGESPASLVAGFDSVTICLSKGLGCPAGALLAFESRHWERVRRWKQCMGGSLRQSGMLAAAGLYAMDHNITRIAEDHANARRLAEGLSGLRGIEVEDTTPSSNMVFFRLRSEIQPPAFSALCLSKGFRFSRVGDDRFRAVTHLDVSAAAIDRVISGMKEIAAAL